MPMLKRFFFGSLVLFFSACGGGGGSSTAQLAGSGTVLTGQFIDSAVSGIRYITETRSGITGDDGLFEYLQGETVSLYIGDQLLGDAPGAAVISLFDLVDGIEPLVGNTLKTTLSILNKNRADNWKRGASFNTVINLATLLQTLDKDGNPNNGIEISADVAALFTANDVNFNQPWEDFKHDLGFRKVLAGAKSHALLDSERQIRKAWRAMAHLYVSLGIDSKLRPSIVETIYYYGGDIPTSVNRHTFDGEGKMTHSEEDFDGDGSTDFFYIYTYDAHGNRVRSQSDSSNEIGGLRGYINLAYDADGNLTRFEGITDGNDRPWLLRIYSYDAYGNQTRFEETDRNGLFSDYISIETYDTNGRQTRGDYDEDGDGTTDSTAIWTYSSNGYQIRREYNESDAVRVNTYSYDADDNLLRDEFDYDDDGTPDRTSVYTNDTQGNEIRYEQDVGGDGGNGYSYTTAYDTDGNVILWEYDSNSDGTPSRTWASSYDANGNQTRSENDDDGDGIPDRISTVTYEYASDGNWLRAEYDDNGDGATDSIRVSTYDANGNLLRREHDANLNGIPDQIYTWEYAADKDGWWWALQRSVE